ncbi:hypothetical protein, partial [Burkholderia multivorans]|uniref:hypothetical protein n=1 Tax=Burkholderia multivorans TaxID=87883 RepID=UPI0028703A3B
RGPDEFNDVSHQLERAALNRLANPVFGRQQAKSLQGPLAAVSRSTAITANRTILHRRKYLARASRFG